jgi:hypothetical protein
MQQLLSLMSGDGRLPGRAPQGGKKNGPSREGVTGAVTDAVRAQTAGQAPAVSRFGDWCSMGPRPRRPMFKREHRCSIDRMLCSPTLRSEFVREALPMTGARDEEELLWELMRLRKNKTLSRLS